MYQEWWNLIKNLKDPVSRLELFEAICTYGVDGQEPDFGDDNMKRFFVSSIQPKLDENRGKYQEKVLFGESTGRKKVVDDNEIYKLANAGLGAKEIAAMLSISVDSVYHSKGWVNRIKISKAKSKRAEKVEEKETESTAEPEEQPAEVQHNFTWNF